MRPRLQWVDPATESALRRILSAGFDGWWAPNAILLQIELKMRSVCVMRMIKHQKRGAKAAVSVFGSIFLQPTLE